MKDETLGRGVVEGITPSLNQKVCLMLGERQLFVSLPYDGVNTRKPDWGVIIEFAKSHPAARLLLWLNNEIREL